MVVANPETIEQQIQKNPAFRIPTRAEIIAQQIAEEDARAKKRNGFSSEAWVIRNDGSEYINTPDDGSVSYNTVSGPDWGGCSIDVATPDEQAWDNAEAFEHIFTQNSLDSWWEQDLYQGPSAYAQYYETGSFDLSNDRTRYTVMNAKLVLDDSGEPSYIDDGMSCSAPGVGYGQALLDAQAKVLAQEAEAAAELKQANLEAAQSNPYDVSDPEVAARIQSAVVTPDYIDVDQMCVNPDSVEGQRIVLAQAELNGDSPTLAAKDAPTVADPADPSAPAQGGDVAAVYTATVDQQAAPPAPTAPSDTVAAPEPSAADRERDAEFQRIMNKFDLTPEQVKLKQEEAAPPAVVPAAAPQFEPSV